MEKYTFRKHAAKEIGIVNAVFLEYLYSRVDGRKTFKKDGYTWFSIMRGALYEDLSLFTEGNVRRLLGSLEDKGLIKTESGNYPAVIHIALTDKGKKLIENT